MKKSSGLRIFKGAVAIVTGGGSGIGRALAEELATRGAAVTVADINEAAAAEVADKIRTAGGDAEHSPLDVKDNDAVAELVRNTVEKRGRLDFMFNNAGIGVCGELKDFSHDDWKNVLDVDLGGVINGIQAAYPIMLEQGFGHIVNTASIGGMLPLPLIYSYTAAKYAIVGLTLAARVEAQAHGVRMSVVCPGVIRTPLLEMEGDGNRVLFDVSSYGPDEIAAAWAKMKPMDPQEFARRVIALVARNKPIIIVPGWWKIIWMLNRLFPAFFLKLVKLTFYDDAMKKINGGAKK